MQKLKTDGNGVRREEASTSPVFGLVNCRWVRMGNSQGVKNGDFVMKQASAVSTEPWLKDMQTQLNKMDLLGGPAAYVTSTLALPMRDFQELVSAPDFSWL